MTVENSKEVYGLMIKSLLPTGLFGVMAAALMAALMGNLASAANSISTLFSYDLWKRFRPDTPEHRLVIIGRTATFLSFVLGIALVPLLDLYESIFAAINDVIAHMAPPITCVFMLGVFWGKASGRSAKYTMWLGSALGGVAVRAQDAARLAAGDLRLDPALLLRNAVHDDGLLPVLRLRRAAGGPELSAAEAAARGSPAALLGPPAGCPEIGRLAGAGRLSGPGRAGVRGHGRPVRCLSLGPIRLLESSGLLAQKRVVAKKS